MGGERQRKRRAARAPEWVRRPAAQIGGNTDRLRHQGTFGPASDVRHIDPRTGCVISIERARGPDDPQPVEKIDPTRRKPNAITISTNGPPCPRCARSMLIRVHGPGWQIPIDRGFYLKWFKCQTRECPTTEIMPKEYRCEPSNYVEGKNPKLF